MVSKMDLEQHAVVSKTSLTRIVAAQCSQLRSPCQKQRSDYDYCVGLYWEATLVVLKGCAPAADLYIVPLAAVRATILQESLCVCSHGYSYAPAVAQMGCSHLAPKCFPKNIK